MATETDRPGDDVADSAPEGAGRGLDASRLQRLVGYAASRASYELRRAFNAHVGPLGLKVVEFSILVLVRANRQVNQKQLAQALDLSPPRLAVTLDHMVEAGWVQRVRSTSDRRAQHIHLTPEGQALCERAEAISQTMERDSLARLSPAEQALLIELLLKVSTPRKPAPLAARSQLPN